MAPAAHTAAPAPPGFGKAVQRRSCEYEPRRREGEGAAKAHDGRPQAESSNVVCMQGCCMRAWGGALVCAGLYLRRTATASLAPDRPRLHPAACTLARPPPPSVTRLRRVRGGRGGALMQAQRLPSLLGGLRRRFRPLLGRDSRPVRVLRARERGAADRQARINACTPAGAAAGRPRARCAMFKLRSARTGTRLLLLRQARPAFAQRFSDLRDSGGAQRGERIQKRARVGTRSCSHEDSEWKARRARPTIGRRALSKKVKERTAPKSESGCSFLTMARFSEQKSM